MHALIREGWMIEVKYPAQVGRVWRKELLWVVNRAKGVGSH